eukprot:scaffold283387_cov31-Tisochrysis_lutea.AAC.1
MRHETPGNGGMMFNKYQGGLPSLPIPREGGGSPLSRSPLLAKYAETMRENVSTYVDLTNLPKCAIAYAPHFYLGLKGGDTGGGEREEWASSCKRHLMEGATRG